MRMYIMVNALKDCVSYNTNYTHDCDRKGIIGAAQSAKEETNKFVSYKYCKDMDKRIGEDILRSMLAGVGGGILCWLGFSMLIFTGNTAIGAVILLTWFIYMICGIIYFTK